MPQLHVLISKTELYSRHGICINFLFVLTNAKGTEEIVGSSRLKWLKWAVLLCYGVITLNYKYTQHWSSSLSEVQLAASLPRKKWLHLLHEDSGHPPFDQWMKEIRCGVVVMPRFSTTMHGWWWWWWCNKAKLCYLILYYSLNICIYWWNWWWLTVVWMQMMWVQRTILVTTFPLPGILRWFPVTSTQMVIDFTVFSHLLISCIVSIHLRWPRNLTSKTVWPSANIWRCWSFCEEHLISILVGISLSEVTTINYQCSTFSQPRVWNSLLDDNNNNNNNTAFV